MSVLLLHRTPVPLAILAFGLLAAACSPAPTDYALQPIPHTGVDIADEFWAPKLEVNRTVSIRHLFRQYEQRGRFDSPRVIEAAAYMPAKRPDAELERHVDDLIDKASPISNAG